MCLGDSKTTLLLGKEKVLLKLTFGKTLAFTNVLHAPFIKLNLIFVALLEKVELKVLFESNKIVMIKNNVLWKMYIVINVSLYSIF